MSSRSRLRLVNPFQHAPDELACTTQESYQPNWTDTPQSFTNLNSERSDEKKLSELLEEWLTTGDYTPKTLNTHRTTARYIVKAGLTLEDFNTPRQLQEKFAAAVINPEWARQTIATHILRLCSFGNWLARLNYTRARHQPMIRLKRKPKARDVPSDEEVAALLMILQQRYRGAGDTPNRQRCYGKDWLVVWLLVETGARISEVIRAERRDLIEHRTGDVQRHALFIRGTKTDAAERAVAISKELHDALTAYSKRYDLAARLFINRDGQPVNDRTFGMWLTPFCKKLEFSCHVSPHTFRYRRIVKWICEGKSIGEVMTRIGHSDVEMVVYYFNQVRRLMPWIEISGDLSLMEKERNFWRGRNRRK